MNINLIKTFKLWMLSLILSGICLTSCKNNADKTEVNFTQEDADVSKDSLFFNLSLAEWSLHDPIMAGEMNPMDFAERADELGFQGLEYVTSFYAERIKNAKNPQAEMQIVLDSLKTKSEEFGIRNLLLMVDEEGDLAANDSVARNQAVENHKKWVDAAEFLGCHSIRVNLFGSDNHEEWKNASADALGKLAKYARDKNINILVENHGSLSSNADILGEVMQQVNMENCGTLPDFGNFCLKRKNGARWDAECIEEYPRYEGVKKMMPYAKAVSAKSYSFNAKGQEELIDYSKMLKIIKDAGYDGFIGVEYEGTNLSPEEGIMATKNLLIKVGSNL